MCVFSISISIYIYIHTHTHMYINIYIQIYTNHLIRTIWSSSSPALSKESCGSQKGNAVPCGVNHSSCSSRHPRIVVWSTATFSVAYDLQCPTDWVSVLQPTRNESFTQRDPRVHEIECRLVGFARSSGNDRFKGSQACRQRCHPSVRTQ